MEAQSYNETISLGALSAISKVTVDDANGEYDSSLVHAVLASVSFPDEMGNWNAEADEMIMIEPTNDCIEPNIV